MSIPHEIASDFYEKRREALAKQYYYGDRCSTLRRRARYMEGTLSIATGGTFVSYLGNLAVPEPIVVVLTGVFGIVAFLLSVIKTQWDIEKDIERYSQLHSAYSLTSFKYDELADMIMITSRDVEGLSQDKLLSDFCDKFIEVRNLKEKIHGKEDSKVDAIIEHASYVQRVDTKLPEERRTLTYVPLQERLRNKQVLPL